MKDTFYFQHDTNARGDRKLVKLQMSHGMEGIGIFWCIVEMLYENAGYLPLEYDRITFELRTDINVIRSVINDFELFENDGERFWSDNALMQFNERMDKSTKASNSVKKRWEKYERNTKVKRTKNDSNTKEERRGEDNIYTSIEFYKSELTSSKNDSQYSRFIEFLKGKNEIDKQLDSFLAFPEQISFNQFQRLLKKYSENGNGRKITDMILAMENDPKYTKGKKSAYLTLNNWITQRFVK